MLTDERDLIREGALRAWHHAEALTEAANSAVAEAVQITMASHSIGARAQLICQRKGVETIV